MKQQGEILKFEIKIHVKYKIYLLRAKGWH